MKPEGNDSDNLDSRVRPFPDYPNLNLQQLFLFQEIKKSGSQIEVASRYTNLSPSKVSKDIKELKRELNLGHIEDRVFWESPEAEALEAAITPLMDLYRRFSHNDHPRSLLIGGGGSILGWLVGRRSEEVRMACSYKAGIRETSVYDFRLDCRPMSNRQVFSAVASGLIDLGIIRTSLLDHSRAARKDTGNVASTPLGKVRYGMAVPHQLKKSWEATTNWKIQDDGYLLPDSELWVLNRGFFVSVGPEGEFREQLNRVFADAGIDVQIEFSYRSFPQILPHLIAGTHFGLCPVVSDWKVSPDEPDQIPNCDIYPLRLTDFYDRSISLIWNKKLLKPWIDPIAITEILTWPRNKSSRDTSNRKFSQ